MGTEPEPRFPWFTPGWWPQRGWRKRRVHYFDGDQERPFAVCNYRLRPAQPQKSDLPRCQRCLRSIEGDIERRDG